MVMVSVRSSKTLRQELYPVCPVGGNFTLLCRRELYNSHSVGGNCTFCTLYSTSLSTPCAVPVGDAEKGGLKQRRTGVSVIVENGTMDTKGQLAVCGTLMK